jgi:hypothetical protein
MRRVSAALPQVRHGSRTPRLCGGFREYLGTFLDNSRNLGCFDSFRYSEPQSPTQREVGRRGALHGGAWGQSGGSGEPVGHLSRAAIANPRPFQDDFSSAVTGTSWWIHGETNGILMWPPSQRAPIRGWPRRWGGVGHSSVTHTGITEVRTAHPRLTPSRTGCGRRTGGRKGAMGNEDR